MKPRKQTVTCPKCHKRFSPQGLNGHMRFVHGLGAEEAAKAVAKAPKADDSTAVIAKLEQRVEDLEEMVEQMVEELSPVAQDYHSRAGPRRRLVALFAELADVKKQRTSKDFEIWWSSSDEERHRVLASYDQIEADILREINEQRAKLGEPEK